MPECNLQVGQLVVCIESPEGHFNPEERKPYVGQILTIREIFVTDVGEYAGIAGLRFEEIVNPKLQLNKTTELGFVHFRFRPVKKTSIDCFIPLLKTKELEDA